MADDTQPERGLVLLNEWHVGLLVQSAMSPDEADQLRARVEESLRSWRAAVSVQLGASSYVVVDS
jgi:hypothetical protein